MGRSQTHKQRRKGKPPKEAGPKSAIPPLNKKHNETFRSVALELQREKENNRSSRDSRHSSSSSVTTISSYAHEDESPTPRLRLDPDVFLQGELYLRDTLKRDSTRFHRQLPSLRQLTPRRTDLMDGSSTASPMNTLEIKAQEALDSLSDDIKASIQRDYRTSINPEFVSMVADEFDENNSNHGMRSHTNGVAGNRRRSRMSARHSHRKSGMFGIFGLGQSRMRSSSKSEYDDPFMSDEEDMSYAGDEADELSGREIRDLYNEEGGWQPQPSGDMSGISKLARVLNRSVSWGSFDDVAVDGKHDGRHFGHGRENGDGDRDHHTDDVHHSGHGDDRNGGDNHHDDDHDDDGDIGFTMNWVGHAPPSISPRTYARKRHNNSHSNNKSAGPGHRVHTSLVGGMLKNIDMPTVLEEENDDDGEDEANEQDSKGKTTDAHQNQKLGNMSSQSEGSKADSDSPSKSGTSPHSGLQRHIGRGLHRLSMLIKTPSKRDVQDNAKGKDRKATDGNNNDDRDDDDDDDSIEPPPAPPKVDPTQASWASALLEHEDDDKDPFGLRPRGSGNGQAFARGPKSAMPTYNYNYNPDDSWYNYGVNEQSEVHGEYDEEEEDEMDRNSTRSNAKDLFAGLIA